MIIVLDTNCFIAAVKPANVAHAAVSAILLKAETGRIHLRVSRHSLHELEKASTQYPDGALEIAAKIEMLPYFPIGTIHQLLGTIHGLSGTLADTRANALLDAQLSRLAKAGTDLRDRGALIDALHASADLFVTSDGQLSKDGPASRIQKELKIRVLTPQKAATLL